MITVHILGCDRRDQPVNKICMYTEIRKLSKLYIFYRRRGKKKEGNDPAFLPHANNQDPTHTYYNVAAGMYYNF